MKRLFYKYMTKSIWSQLILSLLLCLLIGGGLSLGARVMFANESTSMAKWTALGLFLNPGSFMNYIDRQGIDQRHILTAFLIVLFGSVIFTGVLIALFGGIVSHLSDKIRSGQVFYRLSNHALILGYDNTVPDIISQILNGNGHGSCRVLLQSTMPSEQVTQLLRTKLSQRELNRVMVVHARRDSREDLMRMRVQQAQIIFIVGELDEPEHDNRNVKTWELISQMVDKPITVRLSLDSQCFFSTFQRYEVSKGGLSLRLRPYNFDELWARKVLVPELNNCSQTVLDYQPILPDSNRRVHFVVNGMSSAGIALAIEAAHIAHYPNFITRGIRTRITFIAEDAFTEMHYLLGQYAELFKLSHYSFYQYDGNTLNGNTINHVPKDDFLDIEWEFIQANIGSTTIRELIEQWCNDPDQLLSMAFCYHSPMSNMAASLYLPAAVYNKHIPILVWHQEFNDNFINLGRYGNIHHFGSYSGLDFEFSLPLAKEIDRDYCRKNGLTPNWEALAPSKKWSNIYSALSFFSKLRSMGLDWTEVSSATPLDDDTVELFAEVEHNRWNIEELLLGYRPTTAQEQNDIATRQLSYWAMSDDERTNIIGPKKEYRDKFIHYDIRRYNDLRNDDYGINVKEYDRNSIEAMCGIVEKYRSV